MLWLAVGSSEQGVWRRCEVADVEQQHGGVGESADDDCLLDESNLLKKWFSSFAHLTSPPGREMCVDCGRKPEIPKKTTHKGGSSCEVIVLTTEPHSLSSTNYWT